MDMGSQQNSAGADQPEPASHMTSSRARATTSEEWLDILGPDRAAILRAKGTEPPFSGDLLHMHDEGIYCCAGCDAELFSSGSKYDSGTGWPSFHSPVDAASVEEHADSSHGLVRTEVTCSTCGGHLGHVFDGEGPGGAQRYCINSLSLRFLASS